MYLSPSSAKSSEVGQSGQCLRSPVIPIVRSPGFRLYLSLPFARRRNSSSVRAYPAAMLSPVNPHTSVDIPAGAHTSAGLPSKSRKRKLTSNIWEDFKAIYDEEGRLMQGQCVHCDTIFSTTKSLDLVNAAGKDANIDILKWWMTNSQKYPTISRMARDILAVPASTVASKSAFSTGSRVTSDYRSRLNSETVNGLICLQDWMRPSGVIDATTIVEDLNNDDEMLKASLNFRVERNNIPELRETRPKWSLDDDLRDLAMICLETRR